MHIRHLLFAVCLGVFPQIGFPNYLDRPEATQLIDSLVDEYQLDRSVLEETLANAEHQATVIEAISRPAERRLAWYEYREIFLQPLRVRRGVRFWSANREVLTRAETEFGVPAEVIVAIIGVETDYGRVMGSYSALDALATLAFDYPPRSEFFRKELGQLLVLASEEGRAVEDFKGSYAGALGMAQFMPSSFRAYAVDFTGDSRKDIWTSADDAIGSVANYLAVHGWRPGHSVIMPVVLEQGSDLETLRFTGEFDEAPTRAELEAEGVVFEDPAWKQIEPTEQVMITSFDRKSGPVPYAGLKNFYVITRYNRSHMYALAVHQLSELVRKGFED